MAIVCNLTPEPRHDYVVGVPGGGTWREVLNTDAEGYGGSGVGNSGSVVAEEVPWHGQPFSVTLSAPPLGTVWLLHE